MEKDFDFEKELGFDPNAFLDGEDGFDADIDLSEFSDEELGLTGEEAPAANAEEEPELDLDDLDALLGAEAAPSTADSHDPFLDEDEEEADFPKAAFDEGDFADEEPFPEDTEDFGQEPDFPDGLFGKRASIYQNAPAEQESAEDSFQDEELPEEPAMDEAEPEETQDAAQEQPRPRRERKPRPPREPKEHKPNIFTKLFDLYFGPVLNKEQQEQAIDPANPRRRRRKSKQQIFKEVYLPPIIACVALVLMMSFVIGSISNAIDQKRITDAQKEQEIQASISQAQQEEAEYRRVLEEAAELALRYDYKAAAEKLETFSGYSTSTEMQALRAEYITALGTMVEYKDPSTLPNLSFQPLMVDATVGVADEKFGGQYNKNFVTVDEFRKILEELYSNGYVLVDFDSFIQVSQTVSGEDQFITKSILLPNGKKPVMITETMVSYYQYMVDSHAFASRLVLDGSGNIKAEYTDASGNTQVGNYDLVPILEEFIAEHPDFSYQGARAILAPTGDEGIFGYRCNTSYISNKGNDWYEQEKAGAIAIVNALKQKGYTLGCYTYANDDYRQLNATQISANLQSWTQQIAPIIGDIDVFVYAKGTDISDYTGTAFKSMYTTGFRYFIASGKSPSTTVNNTYVHQNRLMVTGEYMRHYSDRFTGLFDCNRILDLTARGGDVPKSG